MSGKIITIVSLLWVAISASSCGPQGSSSGSVSDDSSTLPGAPLTTGGDTSLPLVAKSQLELRGQVGISYIGGPNCILMTDPIHNLSAKDSREVRIEFWYAPSPGTMTNFIGAHKAAQYSLGVIPKYGSVVRTVTPSLQHTKPPPGIWKEVILITERIGIAENDGFAIQTTVVFSGTRSF